MIELVLGSLFLLALFGMALYLALKSDAEMERKYFDDLKRAQLMERDRIIFPKEPYSGPILVKDE